MWGGVIKVIGEGRDRIYIYEIHHTELEKFLNQYYGNLKKLQVGDVIDLGRGHDFAQEIEVSMKKTSDFIESNKTIIQAIINGVRVAGTLREPNDIEVE